MSNGIVVPIGSSGGVAVGVGRSPNVGISVGNTGPRGPRGPQGPMGEVNVVEMTWEEFQALPQKDPETIYVITTDPFVTVMSMSDVQNRLNALEGKAQP